MDFGIAKVLGAQGRTRTGATMGTPAYMAPEQIKGAKDVTARADIYALGVTFYEMLCGRTPFICGDDTDSDYMLMDAQVCLPPPDPRESYPAIPPAVVAPLLKALAKEPGDRFADVSEMRAALEAATGHQPEHQIVPPVAPAPAAVAAPVTHTEKKPWPLLGVGVAILALIGVGIAIWLLTGDTKQDEPAVATGAGTGETEEPAKAEEPSPSPASSPSNTVPDAAPARASAEQKLPTKKASAKGSPRRTRKRRKKLRRPPVKGGGRSPATREKQVSRPRSSYYLVRLMSVPSRAAVFKGKRKKIGRTPMTLKINPGQILRLKLAHGARKDTWITVAPTGDTTIDLTKRVVLDKKNYGGGIPGANPWIP